MTRVYTSNPEVADVVVIDPRQIVVNAKGCRQGHYGRLDAIRR